MTPRGTLPARTAACATIAAAAGLALLVALVPDLRALADADLQAETLKAAQTHGAWMIIVLLALAVVVSPIPSGPIALAAGALYGPVAGGSLTLVGAFLGALLAFFIGRSFRACVIARVSPALVDWLVRPRAQSSLMAIVFASRLLPVVPFDAVSYGAGLTPIGVWRFALATALGAAPICYAFASMGAGLSAGAPWAALALPACAVTLLFPAGLWLRRRLQLSMS